MTRGRLDGACLCKFKLLLYVIHPPPSLGSQDRYCETGRQIRWLPLHKKD